MARHRVEIELDASGRGSVVLDGRHIAARAVEILTRLGQATTVVLELVNVDVSLKADADCYVDVTTSSDESRKYRRFGADLLGHGGSDQPQA